VPGGSPSPSLEPEESPESPPRDELRLVDRRCCPPGSRRSRGRLVTNVSVVGLNPGSSMRCRPRAVSTGWLANTLASVAIVFAPEAMTLLRVTPSVSAQRSRKAPVSVRSTATEAYLWWAVVIFARSIGASSRPSSRTADARRSPSVLTGNPFGDDDVKSGQRSCGAHHTGSAGGDLAHAAPSRGRDAPSQESAEHP
jgi:hypothetical protein